MIVYDSHRLSCLIQILITYHKLYIYIYVYLYIIKIHKLSITFKNYHKFWGFLVQNNSGRLQSQHGAALWPTQLLWMPRSKRTNRLPLVWRKGKLTGTPCLWENMGKPWKTSVCLCIVRNYWTLSWFIIE